MALAFLGGLVLYLLLPRLLAGPQAPVSWQVRSVAFRSNAGFIVLFLAARHAGFDRRLIPNLWATIVAMSAVVAVIGLYQYVSPAGFLNFLRTTAEVPRFQHDILGATPYLAERTLLFPTLRHPTRVGSTLISPTDFCDYLLIGLAFCLVVLSRRARPRWVPLLAALLGVAMLSSNTRADLIALAAIVALVLLPRAGNVSAPRIRLATAAFVVVVLFLPLVSATRLGGFGNARSSSTDHIREITAGYGLLFSHPLGVGLGTGPGAGQRFQINEGVVSDNMILQVGNEVGVPMMLLFAALCVSVIAALARVARQRSEDHVVATAYVGFIGVVIAGQLHHVFVNLPVAWTLWAAAGAALATHVDRRGTREIFESSLTRAT